MKYLDCVEIIVEKEKYAKAGVHKGMQGIIWLDKAIRIQQFLKRNIFPLCLSHHLKYVSIPAFFAFQNEKIFSFQVEDFRLFSVF